MYHFYEIIINYFILLIGFNRTEKHMYQSIKTYTEIL